MNNLPDLPRVINQKEAKFGVIFRRWLMLNKDKFESCTFELKQTLEYSMPFSFVDSKQVVYAKRISSDKGTLIRVQGVNGEPDYNFYKNAPSYVVIRFPNWFYVITMEAFVKERDSSVRKSLTRIRAEAICLYKQGI